MKKIGLLFFVSLLMASCGTNQLYISVQSPAPVTISNEVKKAGIVNRSLPSEEERGRNSVHQVMSGESFAMVFEGSVESIRGLKDALMENSRFESVTILDSLNLSSPVVGSFPSPLSWDQIESICNNNHLDALFALEMFDTELKINSPLLPDQVNNPMQVINAVQQTSFNTLVKTGWRIYVPRTRTIIDEYLNSENMTFNSNGNVVGTLDAMIQRKQYVKQTANAGGHAYAERILTHWHRVVRDYYIKGGTQNFKIATRRARAGNWGGAAELWQKEVNNPKRKSAGRATYNMAIINEINGNLDEAIRWSQKAYEEYNVKLALQYINILNSRKSEEDLINIQQTK